MNRYPLSDNALMGEQQPTEEEEEEEEEGRRRGGRVERSGRARERERD